MINSFLEHRFNIAMRVYIQFFIDLIETFDEPSKLRVS